MNLQNTSQAIIEPINQSAIMCTPWRNNYIKAASATTNQNNFPCVFCDIPNRKDDAALILHNSTKNDLDRSQNDNICILS